MELGLCFIPWVVMIDYLSLGWPLVRIVLFVPYVSAWPYDQSSGLYDVERLITWFDIAVVSRVFVHSQKGMIELWLGQKYTQTPRATLREPER